MLVGRSVSFVLAAYATTAETFDLLGLLGNRLPRLGQNLVVRAFPTQAHSTAPRLQIPQPVYDATARAATPGRHRT